MEKKYSSRIGILLIILFSCLGVLSVNGAGTLRSNTLILVNEDDISSFLQVCKELKSQGFIPFHKFPPSVVIGYDPGNIVESYQNKNPRIVLITRDFLDLSLFKNWDKVTRNVAHAWNTMLLVRQGNIPPEILGKQEDHRGQPPDYIVPRINNDSILGSEKLYSTFLAPPFGAMFSDTSEYYIGDVVVTVICPESNGTIDLSTEDWTTAEETTITNRVIQAFDQIISEEGRGFITYTYDFRYKEPCGYEAAKRWNSSQSAIWVSEIMDRFGYTGYSSAINKTRAFCNDQRNTYNTDWAHVIYMVDVANEGAQRAYAYLGGPYNLNDTEDSYTVIMHETGHVFYALDEYSSSACSCTRKSGYLGVENQNCQNGICLLDGPCRMIWNSPPFCKYSQGQIGWIDTDMNGLPDVIDTHPNTSLSPFAPDPSPLNVLTYTGTATVVPLKNNNPGGAGNDISINTITSVEYRINGGSWIPATAIDAAFDGPVEDFYFTTSALPNGAYLVETRATNNYGNTEYTYAYDYVVVKAPTTTAVPTPTGTWYTPTVIPSPTPTPYYTYFVNTSTPTPIGGATNTPTMTSTPTITPTSKLQVHSFPFCDSFENGVSNWFLNAGGKGSRPFVSQDDTLEGGLTPIDGKYVAYLGDSYDGINSESTMDLFINLAGRTNVVLDFWWVVHGGSGSRGIQLDIHDGSWHLNVNGLKYKGNTWQHVVIDLDAMFTMKSNFLIRFHTFMANTEHDEAAYVDAVCIYDPTLPKPTIIPTGTFTPTPTSTPTDTPDLFSTSTPTPTPSPTDLAFYCPYVISLDTDPGWTRETGWSYGKPLGMGGIEAGYPDPGQGHSGQNVYGYNLAGDYDNNLSTRYYLVSDPFDCSMLRDVILSFWRYLNIEGYYYDQATVEISDNGVNWIEIWRNDPVQTIDNNWVYQEFDISGIADGKTTIYVRWGLGPTDGSIRYSGFNIDDITLCGKPATTPTVTVTSPVPMISFPVIIIVFIIVIFGLGFNLVMNNSKKYCQL